MGHSMGSFIARAWLSMYGNGVDGAIIMGTAGKNSAPCCSVCAGFGMVADNLVIHTVHLLTDK